MKTIPFRSAADVAPATAAVEMQLRRGGLLIYPTETVYGVGGAPRAADVAALAALKQRPSGKPFLLLIGHETMAEAWGLDLSGAARALADLFWPGPLTLVLRPTSDRLPDILRGPEGGVAVRHTSHPHLAAMISALDLPLTSTSANRPGHPPSTGVGGAADMFGPNADLLILDGGVLGNVPPSTLVDCTGAFPRLIREGAIPRAELRARAGSLAP